jgi:hypothetical protein
MARADRGYHCRKRHRVGASEFVDGDAQPFHERYAELGVHPFLFARFKVQLAQIVHAPVSDVRGREWMTAPIL